MEEGKPLPRVPRALQRRLVPRRDLEPERVHVVRGRRLEQEVVNQGLAHTARHVIQLIAQPRFWSSSASYDVVDIARHVIQLIVNPHFSS